MKQPKRRIISVILLFMMTICMNISCMPVYAAVSNSVGAVGAYAHWKNNAVIYPQAGQLVAAGPIYLQWNKLDDAVEYNIYIDDELQGVVKASHDNVIEYEIYSTSVAAHKLKIVAELNSGEEVTANIRTFFISKKGMGSGMIDKVQESGLSWYYNWSTDSIDGADPKMQFVPMIWGQGEYGPNWLKNPDNKKYKTILGFNEPDFKDQSNISVDEAAGAWSNFTNSGLRVGSPATGVAAPWSNDWFAPFMNQVDSDVDFIAIHCYLDWPLADTFIEMIDNCYKEYHKPIWITEFAIARWDYEIFNGNDKEKIKLISEFMEKVIPELDKRDYVERYAWFPFDPTDGYGGASGLYNLKTGELNSLGLLYRSLGNPKGYMLPNLDGNVDPANIPQDVVVDDGNIEPIPDPEDPQEKISKTPKIDKSIYTWTTTVTGTAGSNADITLSVDKSVSTTSNTNTVTTGAQAVIESEFKEKEIGHTKADKNGKWSVNIPAQSEGTVIKITAKEKGKKEAVIKEIVKRESDQENFQEEISKTPKVNKKIYTSTTTVTGTAGAYADIILSVDGKEIGYTKADKDGKWSANIPTQKKNSVIKITAKEEEKLESSICVKVYKSSSRSSSSRSNDNKTTVDSSEDMKTIKYLDEESVKNQVLSDSTPVIKVELLSKSIIKKEIFEALANKQNKTLTIDSNNASWTFKGSDILINNISDVDIAINETLPNASITDNLVDGKEIINLSFAQKGLLPGKATIKVNIDSKYNNKTMYLYSYNTVYKRLNLISENISVKNGVVEFDINKGADYILSETPIPGAVTEGWNKIADGNWIFIKNENNIIGWIKDGFNWYLTDDWGIMKTGWIKDIDEKWYYLDCYSGKMKTGWFYDSNGKWYYLDLNSGEMKVGWFYDNNGEWYYLGSDGAMVYDTYIDGYYINSNGTL